MNLSGGLNLSSRSNMLGSTKNCIQFSISIFDAKLKPVFGGFKPRLNFIIFRHRLHIWIRKIKFMAKKSVSL